MDNALAGTLQMFQSRAVPWGGINRGPKRQQLKTFKLFTISKANGRGNRPDLHHFPGNRPGPNQKLVASHSEYAYFGTSRKPPHPAEPRTKATAGESAKCVTTTESVTTSESV